MRFPLQWERHRPIFPVETQDGPYAWLRPVWRAQTISGDPAFIYRHHLPVPAVPSMADHHIVRSSVLQSVTAEAAPLLERLSPADVLEVMLGGIPSDKLHEVVPRLRARAERQH